MGLCDLFQNDPRVVEARRRASLLRRAFRALRSKKFQDRRIAAGLGSLTPWYKTLFRQIIGQQASLPDELFGVLIFALITMVFSAFPIFAHFVEATGTKDLLLMDACWYSNGTVADNCVGLNVYDTVALPWPAGSDVENPNIFVNGVCYASSTMQSAYLTSKRGVGDLVLCLIFYAVLLFFIYSESMENRLTLWTFSKGRILVPRPSCFGTFAKFSYIWISIAYFLLLMIVARRVETTYNVCGYTIDYAKDYDFAYATAFQLAFIFFTCGRSLSDYYSKTYNWVDGDSLLLDEKCYYKNITNFQKQKYEEAAAEYFAWLEQSLPEAEADLGIKSSAPTPKV